MTDFTPQVLHLVRVTLEAATPISIGSGNVEEETDVALIRDANGLPIVPGASLQGVLRHLWRETRQEDPRELFGFIDEDDPEAGGAARLFFGFGLPHSADDRAVNALMSP